MLVSRYGSPSLPRDTFPRHRLLDTYERLFPEATKEDIDRFAALFDAAVGQHHGSMLIVAKEAGTEASRLGGQGTQIDPIVLTPDLYHQVSCIDGAVIISPHGVCHAIGVILDGPARPEGTASRGARYNSAIRYVGSSGDPRLAVVVSDDETVDVIPVLMTPNQTLRSEEGYFGDRDRDLRELPLGDKLVESSSILPQPGPVQSGKRRPEENSRGADGSW